MLVGRQLFRLLRRMKRYGRLLLDMKRMLVYIGVICQIFLARILNGGGNFDRLLLVSVILLSL